MISPDVLQNVLVIIHYTAPALLACYYFGATIFSALAARTRPVLLYPYSSRILVLSLSLITLSYAVEAVFITVQILTDASSIALTDANVFAIASAQVWTVILLSFLNATKPPVWPLLTSCIGIALIEILLLAFSVDIRTSFGALGALQITVRGLRICLIAILSIYIIQAWRRISDAHDPDETAPLLSNDGQRCDDTPVLESASKIGVNRTSSASSTHNGDGDESTDDEDQNNFMAKWIRADEQSKQRMKEKLRKKGGLFSYIQEFKLFVPILLPLDRRDLQMNMLFIGLCLILIRVLNVLVPRQSGILVESLNQQEGGSPFVELIWYILFSWLSSLAGVQYVKGRLWLPIDAYARASLEKKAYNHIMNLSCKFHDDKASGDLEMTMSQGQSVINLVELLGFDLVPLCVDLVVACGYLYILFDAYMFLIVTGAAIGYTWSIFYTTQIGSDLQRKTLLAEGRKMQLRYDTISSWKTVSYFNRTQYTQDKYGAVVASSYRKIITSSIWANFSTSVQGFGMDLGLYAACFYAVYQVLYCGQSVGSFIVLLAYWNQLSGTLQYLSRIYRDVLSDLIDAEKLLELLSTKSTIADGPGTLQIRAGRIEFKNVNFSYDGVKEILNGIDMQVEPGQTVALVGATGSGKSTILKLLFRFYDVTGGSITIDGQNVRDVSLESLHEEFGVVPQDPVLFNDTILANMRYAKLDATREEIEEACKAAAIHDQIMTFTQGYMSMVGEMGVKLSGGELQRIAIARAILKNPKIILLDEATSAVDSETEGKIQEALDRLSSNRTTVIVAHRLSTVNKADLILVIDQGKVLERGSPAELLAAKGKFYKLWTKQMGLHKPERREDTEDTLELLAEQAGLTCTHDDSKEASNKNEGQKDVSSREDQSEEAPEMERSEPIEPSYEVKTPDGVGQISKAIRPHALDSVPSYQKGTASKGGHASQRQHHHSPTSETANESSVSLGESSRSQTRDKDRRFWPRKRKASKQETSGASNSTPRDQGDATVEQMPDANIKTVDETLGAKVAGATDVSATGPRPKRTRQNRRGQSEGKPSSYTAFGSDGSLGADASLLNEPYEDDEAHTQLDDNRNVSDPAKTSHHHGDVSSMPSRVEGISRGRSMRPKVGHRDGSSGAAQSGLGEDSQPSKVRRAENSGSIDSMHRPNETGASPPQTPGPPHPTPVNAGTPSGEVSKELTRESSDEARGDTAKDGA
ncbi:hypothetical protein MMC25_003884 [Agyrium rufum]|nr:hypothetical protein [Agyrium rufum]